MVYRIFAVLMIAVSSFSIAQTTSSPPVNSLSDIAAVAEEVASNYHEMGWFSGSILLTKDGKPFFKASYGLQDISQKKNNSLKTKFNLGSIMKNYTNVLVLQQLEAGKLKLDDTIDNFELDLPKAISSKITIRHLLNHRSGFADIFTAEYRENQLAFDTLDKKLQLLNDQKLLFEPGTEQRYSNYGYVVLGVILEKVTNLSFEDLLIKNIFNRLNLHDTTFRVDTKNQNQSIRYSYMYDGTLKEAGVLEHPSPDGGIESTVHDVQKFYRELFYGNLLVDRSRQDVKDMFAMTGKHWGSFGGGLGVSAAVEVNLEAGIEIVVLANTDNLVAEFISGRIQSFITKGTYPAIKPLEINYAFNLYRDKGKEHFYKTFQNSYTDNGYTQFIGRTINELGMQLLSTESWDPAFDIFNYLVYLFPDAPQAYDSLAFAYLSKGEAKSARSTFLKALDIDGDFNSAYVSNNYLNTTR